jgi:hypothetical protein
MYCTKGKQIHIHQFNEEESEIKIDIIARRIWRYQRGNQKPYIEKEQIIQWPKEKVQKAKQRSTKHTYKAKEGAVENGQSRDTKNFGGKPQNEDNQAISPTHNT